MFRGNFDHGMDEKGRVPFPARFREVLSRREENVLVVMRWFEPCVRIYPLKEWEQIEQKLGQLPQFDANAQRVRRLVTGEASEVELDKQGRILIPERLRTHAGVEREAKFAGTGQWVELWNPTTWQAHRDESVKDRELMERVAATFAL